MLPEDLATTGRSIAESRDFREVAVLVGCGGWIGAFERTLLVRGNRARSCIQATQRGGTKCL